MARESWKIDRDLQNALDAHRRALDRERVAKDRRSKDSSAAAAREVEQAGRAVRKANDKVDQLRREHDAAVARERQERR